MKFLNKKNHQTVTLEQISNLLRKKYIDINNQELPPDIEQRQIAFSFIDLFINHEDETFAQALIQVQADSILFMAQLVYLGMKLQSTLDKNNLQLQEDLNEPANDNSTNDTGSTSVQTGTEKTGNKGEGG